MQFTIKQGMNQDILKTYPDNHFDSIVTDPPYGIEFLGKDWDSNTGAVETWEQCYRVLKPGGHILAFSAARTYHHLATNIESVGFEIRDQLMWIYASGFPKAQDIGKAIQKRQGVEEWEGFVDTTKNAGFGQTDHARVRAGVEWSTKETQVGKAKCTSPEAKQWSGWKTALKPAHEPIVMARKPFKGSAIDNVLEHGTGALNIDATRIPIKDDGWKSSSNGGKKLDKYGDASGYSDVLSMNEQGRFPSNVFGEIPDYQKYFYCPKVSRAERHCGFERMPESQIELLASVGGYLIDHNGKQSTSGNKAFVPGLGEIYTHGINEVVQQIRREQGYTKKGYTQDGSLDHIATGNNFGDGLATSVDIMSKAKGYTQDGSLGRMKDAMHSSPTVGNNHPTVKPVALMSYLVKLVTPPGGKVLDPYNGSGSTGMACVQHGFDYTGCELDPAYVEIANKRINGWYNKTLPDNNFNELFEGDKP